MTARTIDGKHIAAQLQQTISSLVPGFVRDHNRAPGLAVVIVGDDPASHVYVGAKHKASISAGMASFAHRLNADTSQQDLLALIETLNQQSNVDGILVQLPLPAHIDEAAVVNAINPEKDVDGFHVVNSGRLATGQDTLVPCTPKGCMTLLRDTLGDLSGLHAVVIGRSNIVGKPMIHLLLADHCTVTVCHSKTRNLREHVRTADIIIAAVGQPALVKSDWIKTGATVIDVGINRVEDATRERGYRLVGDVDYEGACLQAYAVTPVPGGVGPMTIATLLSNTLTAAYRRLGQPLPPELG